MFKLLTLKEIQDQIYSLRFLVGLLLCVLVTLTATVILTQNYQQDMADYRQRIASQDDFLNNYAHTNRLGGMMTPHRPPALFGPLVVGLPQHEAGSFDDNPLPVLFPPLDLVFIVTIVLSLMALLLSYDAICGEREKGTLKLQLSNNVRRATLILAKWAGGSVTLFIPFLLSLLLSGLYITLHPAVAWRLGELFTLLILALGAMTFLSVFYLLGLFISAKTRTASVSILVSLFAWVIWILALPNLSPYIAAQFFKIPSVNRVEKEARQLMGIERDNLGRQGQKELSAKYESEHPEFCAELAQMNQEALKQKAATDAAFAALYNEYRAAVRQIWENANRIQGEKVQKIRADLDAKAEKQTWAAKHIACLSPYACFVYLATELTGTGLGVENNFHRQARPYFQDFWKYVAQKEEAARAADPTFNSNSFLDISDRPHFQYREASLAQRVQNGLPFWGLLCLYGTVLLVLGVNAFLKYDIR